MNEEFENMEMPDFPDFSDLTPPTPEQPASPPKKKNWLPVLVILLLGISTLVLAVLLFLSHRQNQQLALDLTNCQELADRQSAQLAAQDTALKDLEQTESQSEPPAQAPTQGSEELSALQLKYDDLEQQLAAQSALLSQWEGSQAELQQELDAQRERLEQLQQEWLKDYDDTPGDDSVLQAAIAMIRKQNAIIDAMALWIQHLEDENGKVKVVFVSYVVQPGDSITSICQDFGIDYWENINVIRLMNHLNDVDFVYTGQELAIPVSKAR